MLRQLILSSFLFGLLAITLPLLSRLVIHAPTHPVEGQIDILSLAIEH